MRLSPGADPVATAAALTREGRGRVDVERPIESLQREAADMRPVVYGTVALLIVIAALNLLTTLGLAIRERERDGCLPLGAWIFMLVIGATDPADGPDVRTLPAWWWYPLAIVAAVAADRRDQRARLARRHAHPPGARAAR